jgi:iron complex outermembrane recepter protein
MQMSKTIFTPAPAINPLVRMAVRNALKGAMLTGTVVATFGAGTAQAQQAPPATASNTADATLQEVVVTGSRIKQPALESVSPVTLVSAAEIQQSGTARIEDILNQLPQVVGDMGSALANGATGAATVSLRGLGCQRTLVLVNGRRLMPGDPTQAGTSCSDLNQIPSDLVENVDILTGGASAVYGADAVAGVVNFKMNDHFEGVRLEAGDGYYNHSQHNGGASQDLQAAGFAPPTGSVTDGQSADFTAILGSNFDDGRGNAVVYLGYRHTDPVLQGTRDFSACALTSSGPKRVCGGSGTTFPTRFSLGAGSPLGAGSFSVGPGGSLVPTGSLPAGGLYNFAALNYFQRPDDRYTGGAFAHYDINDHAKVYMEFQFMDDRTFAQIAPSGAFTGSGLATTGGIPNGAWSVNCANPYLSGAEYSAFGCTGPAATNPNNVNVTFGRRNVEGGNRTDDLGHTSFREVLGVKGDINDAWNYDTYFQNGITRFSEEYDNDVSKLNMSNALQAVKTSTGQIVCAANANGANNAPGCVPWNIFQPGGVTPAATAYIGVPGEQKGYTQELVWEGDLTGDLGKYGVKLPMANSGLGLNVGADWRQEKAQLLPDEEFITNDLAGQGSPTLPTFGSFTVWEAYTEARLPIMEDQPFAKSLDLEAGYRFSQYSLSFGNTNTWKIGLQWAPVSDVRLRTGYNVAVRAPNIQELYLQQRVELDGTSDPCASPQTTPATLPSASAAACANSGVTAAEYGKIVNNPANQYNGLEGGNTHLKPETADTTTLGLVFTPTFLPAFNATIDYYNIRIKNVIGTYGANLILSTCVNSANPLFCSLVNRAPNTGTASSGSLWLGTQGYVTDATLNLGELQQEGIDFEMNYRLDAGVVGKFDFNLNGNYDLHFKTTPYVGSGTYDCAGYYGPSCGADGGVSPHIKSVFRINYSTPLPGLDMWAKWRFIGPVKSSNFNQNPLLSGSPPIDPIAGIGNQVPGYNYLDLGASYSVTKKITARIGVNNVADKDPPVIIAFLGAPVLDSGNTYPQTYDWGGRYLFANITVDF